ncbi:hypothetical protein ACNKHT_11790 [Shigella flexneri]
MLGSSPSSLAVAVWRPYVYHRDVTPIVKTIELEQNEIRSLLPEASEPFDQAAQEDEAIPRTNWMTKSKVKRLHEYVVSTGDTLSSISISMVLIWVISPNWLLPTKNCVT